MPLASRQVCRRKLLEIPWSTRTTTAAEVDQKCTAEVNERRCGYSSSCFPSILRARLKRKHFVSCPEFQLNLPRQSYVQTEVAYLRDEAATACFELQKLNLALVSTDQNRPCCSHRCYPNRLTQPVREPARQAGITRYRHTAHSHPCRHLAGPHRVEPTLLSSELWHL